MICSCGNTLNITDPVIEIVNQVTVSMLVVNHGISQGKKCGICGQEYFIAIQGFNMKGIQLIVLPVPKEEQSRIIMPN